MKKIFLILMVGCFTFNAAAKNGDTLAVKAFNFYSKLKNGVYDSTIVFPEDTVKFQRIMMKYTLRCPFKTQCGEWDYLTYTHLLQPTGKWDSSLVKAPYFRADGAAKDTLRIMKNISWNYFFNSTTKKTDSVANNKITLVFFRDKNNPEQATDTLYVYPVYARKIFNSNGKLTSSVNIKEDSILVNSFTNVYHKYEVNTRYELARFITPYGNGLTLGNNGFTWWYDVTEYRPLLHDTVHLVSGNWQELLNLEFIMIKGTPPADVIKIDNLWNVHYPFTETQRTDTILKAINYTPLASGKYFNMNIRTTGHGFGGNENCAEFCQKNHYILVDGTTRFQRVVFRDDCSLNPVYPQGGTWVYSRTNWCPGAPVETYQALLSNYITPGKKVSLDYNIDAYDWNGKGSLPYYAIETQMFTYSKANFKTDAAVYEISAPSNKDIYKRMNPICDGALITIQNTGEDTLHSLDITYGITGDSVTTTYHWQGALGIFQKQELRLGTVNWNAKGNEFKVSISNPNGQKDMYDANNIMTSYFAAPVTYPNKFLVKFTTNNSPEENAWKVTDQNGFLVKERKNLKANTTYTDTLNLKTGCYEFTLTDSGLDGLSFWANPGQGTGSLTFRKTSGVVLKSFPTDFGAKIYLQFSVGLFTNDIEDQSNQPAEIEVYPNPTRHTINIDFNSLSEKKYKVELTDMQGRIITTDEVNIYSNPVYQKDISGFKKGMYIVRIISEKNCTAKKISIE